MTDVPFPCVADDSASYTVAAEPASIELLRLARQIPESIRLGASSWSFPGWQGIVWAQRETARALASHGLSAYAKHPIFRVTGLDRVYYRAIPESHYAFFAKQVPEGFRFLVKAPQDVTDSVLRTERGIPTGPNPTYLDLDTAVSTFVEPACRGLGRTAGPLVFELSGIPKAARMTVEERQTAIHRMIDFFGNLPKTVGDVTPQYGVEMRTPELLTPRFVDGLRETGVRLVIGIHPKMPEAQRQILALRRLDAPDVKTGDWELKGDVIVRWSLSHLGTFAALKRDWSPFTCLQEPDLVTREAIVWLLKLALRSGVRSTVVANNKAEGCAPLTIRAIAESLIDQIGSKS